MTRSNKLKFKKLMTDLLAKHGAKPGGRYDLVLSTKLGDLYLTVYDGTGHRNYSPWIASMFEDPDRAKQFLGAQVNPYSGKWNHQFPDSWTPQECVEEFDRQLTRVLDIGKVEIATEMTAGMKKEL